MMEQDKKTGFRESLSLLRYGFRTVGELTPSFLPLALLRALLSAAQPLIVLFFSARILNELSGSRDVEAVAIYAGATVGLTFIASVLRAILTREIETSGGWEQAFHRIQLMQAERFTKMDYAYAEDSKLSERLARMDTQAMGNGLGLMRFYFHVPMLVECLLSVVLSVLLLVGPLSMGGGAVRTPMYTWGLFGMLAIGLFVTMRYRSREQKILEQVYVDNAKANTAAGFYFRYTTSDQAAKDIRLYDQVAPLLQIFKDSFNVNTWLSFFMFGGRLQGFNLAMLAAIGGGFYLLTGYDALNGAVSVGGIVQSVGAVTALAGAIGSLVSMGGQIYNNASFLSPLREFMTLKDLLIKGNEPVLAEDGAYRFEFKNVSFRYPGQEGYALEDLNLTIEPGRRMAVVGLNGSGKTTMIKLLCRLYDPTEGEILLNGVNIKEYDYDQYIALFSVVFQDYCLFPLWLNQNVATSDRFDEERVRTSLEKAGFGERLEKLPEGLNTIVYKSFDEDGTQFSGGEAQKIALARALYKDAPIVVLDEPTAALDPIAEYEVYSTFDQTIGEKTAVFISHRLSSCRFCHDIAVFEGGKLLQRGDHETLLKDTLGRYRALWDAQARHYNETSEDEDKA